VKKKAAAGKKIAKEVEKGIAKVLMDKSPAAARVTKKSKKEESCFFSLTAPGAPTKKCKRRSEWGDGHVATEPEDGAPINPPIEDEDD
jgi:hypothetical protein